MSNSKTLLKRLASGIGALALAAGGVLGVSTAANAEPLVGNIDADQTGSVTVHKYVGAEGDRADGTNQGDLDLPPLGGVGFTIYKCDVDLLTVTGPWEDLTCANPVQVGDELFTDADDGTLVFPDLEVGLYRVVETDTPEGVTGSMDTLVTIPYPNNNTWLYDVHIYPKNSIEGEGDKVITDVDQLIMNGSVASWKLTSPVLGSEGLPADSTEVSVTDRTGECLSYVAGSAALSIELPNGTTDDTQDLDVDTSVVEQVTFSYEWVKAGDYPAGTKFVITYETNVLCADDDGAAWNDSDWGKDVSFWGQIEVTKTNADGSANLAGAQFAVYDGACPADEADLGTALVTGTTPSTGLFETGWLFVAKGKANAGDTYDYCLVETQAPAGYVTPAYAAGSQTVALEAGVASFTTNIANTPQTGPQLPLTGSTGTLLFTLLGVGLIGAGAATLAVRKRHAVK